MDIKKGLISVIIPVYNRQDYIEECIRSVQAQSYQAFEIVIVDDGSTDNTYAVCSVLAESDSRIRINKANHGGVSAARNIAIDAASGEFLFFLDSDDVIHPLLFETLVSSLEKTDAAIAGTNIHRIPQTRWDSTIEELTSSTNIGETNYLTFEEALDITFTAGSPLSCVGGVLIRSDSVGDTRFRTDLHIGEDFCFVYEVLIKGCACVFLVPKWYYVRIGSQNSSWDYSYRGFYSRFYRRELVWKNEERCGRQKYANRDKRAAFDLFINCLTKHRPYSSDSKNMRRLVRKHKKELYPGLTAKQKVRYFIYLYFPALAVCVHKIINKK